MHITDEAICIQNTDERHPSQFEKVDFLHITARHFMTRIGQTDKREFLLRPIFAERGGAVRPNGKNLGAPALELGIIVTQARQLRAAIRSHEAAQKGKHQRLAAKIGQVDEFSIRIAQFKLRCRLARLDQISHLSTLWLCSKFHRTFLRSACQSRYFAGWDDRNKAGRM